MSDGFARPACRVPCLASRFFLLALLQILGPDVAAAATGDSSCNLNDTCTLLEFKKGLSSTVLTNWTGPNVSHWQGVTWEEDRASGTLFATKLNLSGVLLNGTDIGPLLQGGLTKLTLLNLSGTGWTGSLPDPMKMCPALQRLDLHGNQLSGPIPQFVSCDSSRPIRLQVLDLSRNSLTGTIPDNLANLSRLEFLELSYNKLTGTIPDNLGGLSNLRFLDLNNNTLSGEIPESLGDLSSLETLQVNYNYLEGKIPENVGNLSNLATLQLKYNKLSGRIPSSLANLSKLKVLMLQNNDLNGTIPLAFSRLSNLITLSLNRNKLSGHISPDLANCTKLRSMWLSQNSLNGSIPPELGNLTDLVVLSLYGNYYNTPIPYQLGRLRNLVVFDLSWSYMYETIPHSLCELHNLEVFFLNNNLLSGSIPECFGNFTHLRLFDLSNNKLTGVLPRNVSALSSKVVIVNDTTTPELSTATYDQELLGQNLTYEYGYAPISFSFQSNNLSGAIPSSFGAIKTLQQLILSNNSLEGSIPASLGDIWQMYYLDLSVNKLSGTIPSSLTHLSFLSTLNLSENHLSGRIPTGGQFSTFSNRSFLGNSLLCGQPLSECQNDRLAPTASPKSAGESMAERLLPMYIILGSAIVCIGFVVALVAWSWRTRGCSGRNRSMVSNDGDPGDSKDDLHSSVYVTTSCALPSLNHKDLARATDNYHETNIIGDGGFGLVYRAVLGNGDVVAVKKLVEDGVQGHGEFLAEMRTLGKISRHRNLVALLGYCAHGRDRILVYEYMKNGCLDTWLHCREEGMESLDWRTRLKVARGAAEGLSFLHHEVSPPIIHRDIKTSNILLDCQFEAHLADFGLARSMKSHDTHVSTDFAGTAGYIPPEYSQISVATTRGDVYSFGVVLLELLTGRRPTDPFFRRKEMAHVVAWMLDVSTEEAIETTVDMTFAASTDETLELMRIACRCCQDTASKRPNMLEVVRMLEALERQQGPSRSPSVVLYEDTMSSPRCR